MIRRNETLFPHTLLDTEFGRNQHSGILLERKLDQYFPAIKARIIRFNQAQREFSLSKKHGAALGGAAGTSGKFDLFKVFNPEILLSPSFG